MTQVAPHAGAWIETTMAGTSISAARGRPPRGGVDRNFSQTPMVIRVTCRPPRGGVDRNHQKSPARADSCWSTPFDQATPASCPDASILN